MGFLYEGIGRFIPIFQTQNKTGLCMRESARIAFPETVTGRETWECLYLLRSPPLRIGKEHTKKHWPICLRAHCSESIGQRENLDQRGSLEGGPLSGLVGFQGVSRQWATPRLIVGMSKSIQESREPIAKRRRQGSLSKDREDGCVCVAHEVAYGVYTCRCITTKLCSFGLSDEKPRTWPFTNFEMTFERIAWTICFKGGFPIGFGSHCLIWPGSTFAIWLTVAAKLGNPETTSHWFPCQAAMIVCRAVADGFLQIILNT